MAKLISADLINNKLCVLEYTTNDATMLSINPEEFDAIIVLHTYTNTGKIIFAKPITTIGEWVFHKCENLTSITIPDSVTTIGEGAFRECNIETIVCCPKIPPAILNPFDEFENLIAPIGSEESYANSNWGKYID